MLFNLRLFSGPAFAILLWSFPFDINQAAHRMAGIFAWIIAWWIFEPIPLAVTSLLGACLAIVLGVADASTVFAYFSDPIIYLFLGSFLLAQAMTRHGLAQRFTLLLLSRKFVERSALRASLTLISFTALLSALLPNTPTMAIVLPIGLAMLANVMPKEPRKQGLVVLALSYASSVGGTVTPLGTPPNILTIGNLFNLTGLQVTFLGWVVAVIPFSICLALFLLWYFKSRIRPENDEADLTEMREDVKSLGPMTVPERQTIFVFALALVLWTLPNISSVFLTSSHPWVALLEDRLPESVAVLFPLMLLFVLPDGSGSRTLTWHDARAIDWGTLLLFGGSIAVGGLIFDTGLATDLGNALAALFQNQPEWVFLGVFAFFTIFVSETASNTACAALVVPVVIASCRSMGYDPVVHGISIALASSLGFMLPIATPPNTLAYSSGKIEVKTMMQHGLIMNAAGWVLIVFNMYWIKFVRDFVVR